MKCIDVMIALVACEVRADVYSEPIMAPANRALKHMKDIIFYDPNIKLDNIVFQTGLGGDKEHFCCVYDSRNLEEGRGGLPLNKVVNTFFEGVYGDSQKIFCGSVAMFFINKEGTHIKECVEDAVELTHLIRCIKWALENEDNAVWHSDAFCDAGVGELSRMLENSQM
jgi:hypothetical protein